MTKTKNPIKKLIRRYMCDRDIESFGELAKATGINYQTLTDHLNKPELFRKFEIKALDEALRFTEEDLILLIRGE